MGAIKEWGLPQKVKETHLGETLYNPAQAVGLEFGFMLVMISISGAFFPSFLGLNFSFMHCLIFGFSGALSIFSSMTNYSQVSFKINIGLGIFFLLNSIIGAIMNRYHQLEPHLYNMKKIDQMAPGFLNLGVQDHVAHLVIAVIFFFEALSWKGLLKSLTEDMKMILRRILRLTIALLFVVIVLSVISMIRPVA